VDRAERGCSRSGLSFNHFTGQRRSFHPASKSLFDLCPPTFSSFSVSSPSVNGSVLPATPRFSASSTNLLLQGSGIPLGLKPCTTRPLHVAALPQTLISPLQYVDDSAPLKRLSQPLLSDDRARGGLVRRPEGVWKSLLYLRTVLSACPNLERVVKPEIHNLPPILMAFWWLLRRHSNVTPDVSVFIGMCDWTLRISHEYM
jgi:hypothetical protein